MSLNSLKEILIKKAEETAKIKNLINSLSQDDFASMVVESLKKMAAHGQNAGRGKRPNAMLGHFANTFTSNADVAIIRDALSHHLSHYKSALQNNQRQKADSHLSKIIPLMHLIHKVSSNSHGRLNHNAPNSRPWEMNYTTDERNANGTFKRGPEGWDVREAPKRVRDARSIPNYRFFEMAPHLGHSSIHPDFENKAYPWEEIQVGSNQDILNGTAYLYNKEVSPEQSRFVSHPFDSHPIHKVFTEKGSGHDDSHVEQHIQDLEKWHNSPEHQKAFDMALESVSKNENGFTKPPRFYEGIEPLEQPEHAKAANRRIKGITEPEQIDESALDELPEHMKNKFGKPKEVQQPAAQPEAPKQQNKSIELPESLQNIFGKPKEVQQPAAQPEAPKQQNKSIELPESLQNIFGKKG